MKISYNWLKRFIELTESPAEVAALLTSSGLEVEKTEVHDTVKGGLRGVVIGEVMSCEKHPGADKLSKTTVNIGSSIVPIVCGAPNVATGQKVIVATVGSTLFPQVGEPIKISKAKIRGEISEGMICAEDELGMGKSHDGIMVLQTQLLPGTDAATFFNLSSDTIFEIGLTPNRADAASHLGVARDLKALLQRNLVLDTFSDFKKIDQQKSLKVNVANPAECPRYSYLLIENIKIEPSPQWLQQALISIGATPVNNIVDITNFILHDIGQPLHAFDAAKFASGNVVVKTLQNSPEIITLDGVARKLSSTDLAICDQDTPLCIAGVLGGRDSGIHSNTTKVFLESAYFTPGSIRKTSLTQSIKTEASFRYERGTDPLITTYALQKAWSLIQQIQPNAQIVAADDLIANLLSANVFEVTVSRIQKLIGKPIPSATIERILNDLDIQCKIDGKDTFTVTVPPYRVDVLREADIVEEVLRIYGINNIQLSAGSGASYIARFDQKNKDFIQEVISSQLIAQGFYEIITNSLAKESYLLENSSVEEPVKVLNALSENFNVLRQTLLFSTLEVLSFNLNRQQKNLKFFEFGKTYKKWDGKYAEQNKLSVAISGNKQNETWQEKPATSDYYFLKNAISSLFVKLGLQEVGTKELTSTQFAYGLIFVKNSKEIGLIGMVDKRILKLSDIKQPVLYAELDADLLLKYYKPLQVVHEIPKFPEVRRDLSLVLEGKINFKEISELALKTEKKLLQSVNVFDVYEGDKLKPGYKSYSVSFVLQDPMQTLTDKVIDQTMARLISTFEKELQAEIRK